MGRTLPSATQLMLSEEASLARFRRALRREDQLVFDDLFTAAQQHISATAYAAHALPFFSIRYKNNIQVPHKIRFDTAPFLR